MSKHLRHNELFTGDTRNQGCQDRFSFTLFNKSERVVLDVFAANYSGEVIASISPSSSFRSASSFLENCVLPVYECKNIRLQAIHTDLGKEFAAKEYRDLLNREKITQVHILWNGGNECEGFANAFHSEFCKMGTINSFYRSAMDLKGDFANWLNLYNRQLR